MAYVIGLITKEEEIALVRRGWKVEDAPKELIDPDSPYDETRMKMFWIDTGVWDIMTGPDWDTDVPENWRDNLTPGDEVMWNDPDEGKCSGAYTITDIKPSEDMKAAVFCLRNEEGSETEAFGHELS
jgi:hypothetical protein